MKCAGYTVRELVVVMIVVALLFSIGLPYLTWRRERARTQQCQNNLRQMGLELLVHAHRNPLTHPSGPARPTTNTLV
jgi:type II secretory pathway pseudopilin PulG